MTIDTSKAQSIFTAAVEGRAPEQWGRYLDDACGDDIALRQRVELLLRAHQGEDSFLDRGQVDEGCGTIDPQISEEPGAVIGQYKLLQQIGEGGMGVVFMAEQTEPIQRTVALKIIKPGMDSRQVIARFEAERQALALMDHPNIARVVDAGTTGTGRPYFVMDLVKGVPITEYCDQQHLSVGQRLELMAAVCQAVQHAHQKGIIHRDLKPSNVLVAEYDGKPVPKVIDFGVAKATAQRLTERTMFTQYGQIVGTFEYMSPEQARFNQLDVDTRSDIYSLGVLLYELLAGSTPLEKERLRSAAFDEILRIIGEEEPPRPSTRLSSSQLLPSISAQRQIEPAKLTKLVRGELDWIVMKCLEKDRNLRYETANGLGQDIERHLSDEPVQACPPSAAYRFRKFAKRNKTTLATATIVAISLILATLVSLWQAAAARRAEGLAEVRLIRSQQVTEFMKEMLNGVGPGVALGQDTKLLKGILNQTAQRLNTELAQQPEVEAELRETLGIVYRDLGDYENAAAMLENALELRRNIHSGDHASIAQAQHYLADVYRVQSRMPEAEAGYREALDMRRRLLGPQSPEVAESLFGLAEVLRRDASSRSKAESIHREVLAMRRKLAGSNSDLGVADSLNSLGVLLGNDAGKQREAEACLRESLEIRRKLLGREHPLVANTMRNLGAQIRALPAKRDEGLALLREALATQRKILGTHRDTAMTLYFLAAATDDPAESEALNREALAMRRTCLGSGHSDVDSSLKALANILRKQKQFDDLESIYREELAFRTQSLGSEHFKVAATLMDLSAVLRDENKSHEAEEVLREAISIQRKAVADQQPSLHKSLNDLAAIQTESAQREALDLRRKLLGNDHPDVAKSLYSLAFLLREQGKLDESEAVYRETLTLQRKLFGANSPDLTTTLLTFAELQRRQGKLAEAEALLRETLEIRGKANGNDHPSLVSPLFHLALVLHDQGKLTDAEPLYRRALALKQSDGLYPAPSAIVSSYSRLLKDQGKPNDPIAMYRLAIELSPQNAEFHNALAWELVSRRNTDQYDPTQAVELAQRAVELAPKEGSVWNTLGVAQYCAGEWQLAIDALGKGMELRKGGDANDWFFLAMAHWQLGHKDEARNWYDKAVEWTDKNQPKNKELQQFRTEAAELLGITEPKPEPASVPQAEESAKADDSTTTSPPTTND